MALADREPLEGRRLQGISMLQDRGEDQANAHSEAKADARRTLRVPTSLSRRFLSSTFQYVTLQRHTDFACSEFCTEF